MTIITTPVSWRSVVVESATFSIDPLGRVKVVKRTIPAGVHGALHREYQAGGSFWLKAKQLLTQ